MSSRNKKQYYNLVVNEYNNFRRKFRDSFLIFISCAVFFFAFAAKNNQLSYDWIIIILAIIYTLLGLYYLMKLVSHPSFAKTYIYKVLNEPDSSDIDLILFIEKLKPNPEKNIYLVNFISAEGKRNYLKFRGKSTSEDIFKYLNSLLKDICEIQRMSIEEFRNLRAQYNNDMNIE